MVRSGEAVMQKVRRYRAIASLYRQTATFRPVQRWSLLEQADEWERLAVAELEAYFNAANGRPDVALVASLLAPSGAARRTERSRPWADHHHDLRGLTTWTSRHSALPSSVSGRVREAPLGGRSRSLNANQQVFPAQPTVAG